MGLREPSRGSGSSSKTEPSETTLQIEGCQTRDSWIGSVIMSTMPKYYIRYEPMGSEWYYMIYRISLFVDGFLERWNTPESARVRLKELQA